MYVCNISYDLMDYETALLLLISRTFLNIQRKHLLLFQLIQFLVTLVQPSANSRMGVGVKRRMPLMLHESPPKKIKNKKANIQETNDNGPTIHELDNELEISHEELFDQEIEDQGIVS